MLGGLDTPTKGSVTLAGKDLYRMKEDALAVFRRRKIGFVFQAFNLVSSVNVWENIVLPLGLDGRKVDEANASGACPRQKNINFIKVL